VCHYRLKGGDTDFYWIKKPVSDIFDTGFFFMFSNANDFGFYVIFNQKTKVYKGIKAYEYDMVYLI